MSIVVSDTSPVRALAFLGLLELLRDLFREVLVPPAVAEELRHPRPPLSAVDPLQFDFLVLHVPSDLRRVQELAQTLDPGESEAIALAVEVNADAILMDEAAGRAQAARLGLVPIGVIGILLRAKQRGLLPGIRPVLDRLQDGLGFYIGPALREETLRRAGEATS